jgi:hypothetical protein
MWLPARCAQAQEQKCIYLLQFVVKTVLCNAGTSGLFCELVSVGGFKLYLLHLFQNNTKTKRPKVHIYKQFIGVFVHETRL